MIPSRSPARDLIERSLRETNTLTINTFVHPNPELDKNTSGADLDGDYGRQSSPQEVRDESYPAVVALASLLLSIALGFTHRGKQRFVEWVTGLALNVEEHTITQSLVALDRAADWKALETFAEYGAWDLPPARSAALARRLDAAARTGSGTATTSGPATTPRSTAAARTSGAPAPSTSTPPAAPTAPPPSAPTTGSSLGALLPQPDQPAWFLPVAGRLYFRKSPVAGAQTGPTVAFRTKCELLVELLRAAGRRAAGQAPGRLRRRLRPGAAWSGRWSCPTTPGSRASSS